MLPHSGAFVIRDDPEAATRLPRYGWDLVLIACVPRAQTFTYATIVTDFWTCQKPSAVRIMPDHTVSAPGRYHIRDSMAVARSWTSPAA